jgi:hypothetical protein
VSVQDKGNRGRFQHSRALCDTATAGTCRHKPRLVMARCDHGVYPLHDPAIDRATLVIKPRRNSALAHCRNPGVTDWGQR